MMNGYNYKLFIPFCLNPIQNSITDQGSVNIINWIGVKSERDDCCKRRLLALNGGFHGSRAPPILCVILKNIVKNRIKREHVINQQEHII